MSQIRIFLTKRIKMGENIVGLEELATKETRKCLNKRL
jgi:hypothetical protein